MLITSNKGQKTETVTLNSESRQTNNNIIMYRNLFFLLIILISFSSCSRIDNNTKPQVTAELLAKSKNFQTLSKLLIDNLNKTRDYKKLAKLNQQKEHNLFEKKEFYRNLGFDNENEYMNFHNTIIVLNNELSSELDFEGLSDLQKTSLINEALDMNIGPGFDSNLYASPDDQGSDAYAGICGEQYSACKKSAYGVYIVTVTGCIAGGIGIAAGSAGWAAPVGGSLAGACAAGAQIQYEGSVKQCYYSYLQCKKTE